MGIISYLLVAHVWGGIYFSFTRESISWLYSCDKSVYISSVYSQCHVDLLKCTELNVNNQRHIQVSQLYVHVSCCLKVIRPWINLPTDGHGHVICMWFKYSPKRPLLKGKIQVKLHVKPYFCHLVFNIFFVEAKRFWTLLLSWSITPNQKIKNKVKVSSNISYSSLFWFPSYVNKINQSISHAYVCFLLPRDDKSAYLKMCQLLKCVLLYKMLL